MFVEDCWPWTAFLSAEVEVKSLKTVLIMVNGVNYDVLTRIKAAHNRHIA